MQSSKMSLELKLESPVAPKLARISESEGLVKILDIPLHQFSPTNWIRLLASQFGSDL